MAKTIEKIEAREILDSRGNPTLEVTVTASGKSGKFSVPSGSSTGSFEALEKRDGDKSYFGGLGVLQAVEGVNTEIHEALKGLEVTDQEKIDETLIALDGTPDKSRLGGNALIGVSVACAKTAALVEGLEVYEYLRTLTKFEYPKRVPRLFMNLINGGKHARSKVAFQEYHVVPETENIEEALEMGHRVQNRLRELIKSELGDASTNLGDEEGFVLDTGSVRKPLELLSKAIELEGLTGKVGLSMDVAASSFYEDGVYKVEGKSITKEELEEILKGLIRDFGVFSIEDPFEEEDFMSFRNLRRSTNVELVGDDLTATKPTRLVRAIGDKSIDSIIIKPNQVGTLSETLATMKLASENYIECIVSHRSGETDDDFIADLAWAFGVYGLKAGAPRGGERMAKYNRLWQIQKQS